MGSPAGRLGLPGLQGQALQALAPAQADLAAAPLSHTPARPPAHLRAVPGPVHEDGFEVAVLMTVGELARVAGTQLRPSAPEVLPLIIEAIQARARMVLCVCVGGLRC